MIDYSWGEPHVFYGAVLGAVFVLLGLVGGGWLWLVIAFAIFVGIAVDVAAHGYQH
jgi:hypothetical protein